MLASEGQSAAFAHGITYHHFHGGDHPLSQGSVAATELENALRKIGLDRILSPAEWIERSRNGDLSPFHRCITFDDNLKCQYDIAVPVLARLGITAFFFVNTSVFEGSIELLEVFRYFRTIHYATIAEFYSDFDTVVATTPWAAEVENRLKDFAPEAYLSGFAFYSASDRRFRYIRDEVLGVNRYTKVAHSLMTKNGFDPQDPVLKEKLWMSSADLRELESNGHGVGLHSHSHPTKMAALSFEAQLSEYQKCFEVLSGILKRPPSAMSHPCNSYNSDTLRALKEIGITTGFRANLSHHPFSLLEQPRLDQASLAL